MQQTKTEKPWGYEILWAKTDKYVGKIIKINNGKRLSLQYHENKTETVFVKNGVLEIILKNGEDLYSQTLLEGESYHIPSKTVHRFCCGKECDFVELIEVSTPELDDVVRLEDDYGRN